MSQQITAQDLRGLMYGSDRGEVALLDVREPGQVAEGHILFSAPLPYSRFEARLADLVPNRRVTMVLCDSGDGVAERAVRRAEAMDYADVRMLSGGVGAWADAGFGLFDGVNVPSKVFGELIEEAEHTPRLPAAEVARMQASGARMVIVDGRPLEEYARMNIPGATCCPNGELALRISSIVPDDETTVVINCAGRTRSIIGAQTLIDFGLPNPVYALENGTQGWELAGLTVERGAQGRLAEPADTPAAKRAHVRAHAERHGVTWLDTQTLGGWLVDLDRTAYLLDVRAPGERAADGPELAEMVARHRVVSAPGGQLVQATDRWVGVRGARIVVLDTEGVRAPMVAAWLARLGHEAAVVEGGLSALAGLEPRPAPAAAGIAPLPSIAPNALAAALAASTTRVIDLRSSADFRAGHVPGAVWSCRPRVAAAAGLGQHFLVADDAGVAAIAARDLREAGVREIAVMTGGFDTWTEAGLPVEVSSSDPPDAERIDYIFHTHDRHSGNMDAARAYLAWEVELIDRLDADERAVFRVG